MKKTILIIFIALIGCKKKHTCECTITVSPYSRFNQVDTSTIKVRNTTKDTKIRARKNCEKQTVSTIINYSVIINSCQLIN